MKNLGYVFFLPFRWVGGRFRRKLIVYFLTIFCISLTIVGTTYYQRVSSEIQRNVYTSMERQAYQSVNTIELYMEYIRNEAFSYFNDHDLQIYVHNMDAHVSDKNLYYLYKLASAVNRNSLIDAITLYDLNDNQMPLILDPDKEKMKILKKWDKIVKEQALNGQGKPEWMLTQILSPSMGIQYTLSYVQALKKISTYEQKIVGVLRIDLNGARLKERLDELKLDGMGEFYITDREGKVLVSEEDKDVGHSLKNEMWFKKYKSGLSPNGHFTVESDGAKWLGVYHEFQSTDWVLIGRIPLTRILQGVNQARNETMSIGALSLVIAMILIIMISAGVTRPLSRLQESMKQVELGNFDAAVPYSSRDEIGFLGLSFNKMTREIKRLIAKIYETELIKKDAEIKALQSQINPHFLYNTLSTLDSLVALHGDARIGLISRGLGEMFRYSISGSGFATVDDEINHVKLYLSIQQVRYEDRLNFSIEVEPGLGEVPMPKLLLQPIVENAVKHGIERKLGQGFISIRVNTGDDNLIQILVEDDGAGMDDSEWKRIQNKLKEKDTEEQQAGERRSSMGLQNISQRIQLLYGEQFKLHITSIKGEGTKVGIILPQINKGDEQGD